MLNQPNMAEMQIKKLILEIEKVENMYLDKRVVLSELRKIIKNK